MSGVPIPGPEVAANGTPLEGLCQRVRDLARRTGEGAVRRAVEEASRIVAEARRQAEADSQADLERARKRIRLQAERTLQSARLNARARLDRFRWGLLDEVLDEAGRAVADLREADPARYSAALERFLDAARRQLGDTRVVARADAADLTLVRSRREAPDIDWREAEVGGGLFVGTPDGNVVADQSFARRRERLNHELRLTATEVLFATGGEGRHE